MANLGIPTAKWREFKELDDAKAYAAELGWRCAIKADGLAGGKGSFVCQNEKDVAHALDELLKKKLFGERILIEELLSGQEVSVFALSDGIRVIPFGSAQDHKRALNDDKGPNTGGMGAYSPVDHMHVAQTFAENCFQPIVNRLAALGTPYKGVLYAGAIITEDGPKILEFNCRFGDPEAEVLLCRLDSDLAEILQYATHGKLDRLPNPPKWNNKDAVCVVIATNKYPDGPDNGQDHGTPITGVGAARDLPGVVIFQAGTTIDEVTGKLVTNGGRILAVTGLGEDLREAQQRAYDAVKMIHFRGKHARTDIATKAIGLLGSDDADEANVFKSEWRKPLNWEHQVIRNKEAIARVAEDVESVRALISDSEKASSQLEEIRTRLYHILGDMNPASTSSQNVLTDSVSGAISELTHRFNEMLERMQSSDAAVVDRVFRSDPTQLREVLNSGDTEKSG